MKMRESEVEIVFVTALDYLIVEGKVSTSVGFEGGLVLTNDIAYIKNLIGRVHALNIGVLEYTHLVSGRPVLYSVRKYVEPINIDDELTDFLREVQSFLVELWIRVDNSVNCQQAFALQKKPDITSVNCLPVFNSAATGGNLDLKLSSRDLSSLLENSPVAVES
ncbi:hypothetical protein GIW30_27305, partial [Pseudomonas sp. PA-5-4G]